MRTKNNNDKKLEYGRVYVVPQRFENLFSIDEALKKGTLFEDLYSPYKEGKSKKNYR